MNPRIMITIENGQITGAKADGNVTVLVTCMDDLHPVTFEVPVRCVTREELTRELESTSAVHVTA